MSKTPPRRPNSSSTANNKFSYGQDDSSLASRMSSRFSAGNLASLAEDGGGEDEDEQQVHEHSGHRMESESVHSQSSSASLWVPSSISATQQQQQRNHHEYGSASSTGASYSAATPNRTPNRTRQQQRRQQRPQKQTQQEEEQQKEGSFLSNLASATGSTALGATMEILKFAGSTTLSTTGRIIAPPLHVTRTILIPALWEATTDIVSSRTPQRAKDWFKIVSSSVQHVTQVLKDTPKGKTFRSKVVTVGADVVDSMSSDASRQVLLDMMSSTVKLSEALHTPEMKSLLEQLAVLGCRVVDAVSSGRNKRLLHDVTDTAWAGIELLADPAATQAFAEVTAYMCHALEMEDAVHRPLDGSATAKSNRAQNRRDRNRFEQRTYVDPTMASDPVGTTEEAILSSLGGGKGDIMDTYNTNNTNTTRRRARQRQKQRNYQGARDDAETGSLPSKVMYDPSNPLGVTDQCTHANSEPTAPPQTIQDTGAAEHENDDDDDEFEPLHNDERDWKDMVEGDVDMQYLEERIKVRASVLEQQRFRRYSTRHDVTDGRLGGNLVNDDVPPLDIEDLNPPTNKHRKRRADGGITLPPKSPIGLVVEQESNGDQEDENHNVSHIPGSFEEFYVPIRDEGNDVVGGNGLPPNDTGVIEERGTAIQQFHRTLDEIMARKRQEAVDDVLSGRYNGKAKANENVPSHEDLKAKSWYPNAAAAAGAGNERGQDTIQYGISSIREAMKSQAAIGVGDKEEKTACVRTKSSDSKDLVGIGQILTGIIFLLVLFAWFGFGCFGIYMYLSSNTLPNGNTVLAQSHPSPQSQQAAQEIIIRVVKEIVHVDSNGEVIENAKPGIEYFKEAELGTDSKDQIANCVADALN